MIRYLVINQELNQATSAYVTAINQALTALGPIGIQDVFVTRRLDYQTVRYATTIVITDPGPAEFRAVFFTATQLQSVDAQFLAFFSANPTYRAVFVRDLSQEIRRRLDHDSTMVLYIPGVMPNCGQDRSRPVIVEATEDVPAGSTGAMEIVSASGLTGEAVVVRNRSGIAWPTGERGIAQVEPGRCDWEGFVTCCAAP